MPLVDLMQEGMKGLMKALEMFDEQPGYHFSTYATHWIRSRILRALVNVNEHHVCRLRSKRSQRAWSEQKTAFAKSKGARF